MFRTFLILLLLSSGLCSASPVDSISVRRLASEDGLSNNLIRCIHQDSKGFMWFGTRDGLNRYDGYGFKIFRNRINDPSSLIHNIIHSINSDDDRNIWIGTRQGVSIYNDIRGEFQQAIYHPFSSKSNKPITGVIRDITRDDNGNMLIGSEALGLLMNKKGSTVATQIPLMLRGKAVYNYGVQMVRSSPNGHTWVFAQNLGLCYLETKSNRLILKDTSITLALSMAIFGGKIWIGTANGLFCYDPIKKTSAIVPDSQNKVNHLPISSIAVDKTGNIWLGTNGSGVFVYHPLIGKSAALSTGDLEIDLKGEQIYAIFIDRASRKWIGTSSLGTIVVDPYQKPFSTRRHSTTHNSVAGNAISAFLEDGQKRLWIGTDGAGLSIWDRKSNTYNNFSHDGNDPSSISSNFITKILQDHNKNIWLGTFDEGLNKYDPATGRFIHYKCINPLTRVESKVAFSLFEDSAHRLWAGTLRRGSLMGALYKFNPAKDQFELFDAKLSDLFTIKQDRSGTIWAGNLNQLIKIDPLDKVHTYFEIGYTVRSIFEDKAGLLWIGTEGGGLVLFDPKKGKIIKRYTTADGISNNSVLTILDDKMGDIWMSTYNGLSEFNLVKRKFRNFYQSDGLQSNQFQINAGLKLSSGEMVFGGIRGFSFFDPSRMQLHGEPMNLFLTDISINSIPLEQQQQLIKHSSADRVLALEVPYNQAVFSFVFTALEYTAPDKISYRYLMEGWDRGWNLSGKERTATYTHVSEGSYVFRVQSTNAEGQWGKNEIVLKIKVLPPWYRTWWAYLGYFSLAIFLFYVYLRYRTAQTRLKYEVKLVNLEVQRKKAEYDSQVARHDLERAEHEREKLINEQEKELTEKRMSFFTNVSHEFRSPLSLIINPINDLIKKTDGQEHKELSMIQRNAKRMLNLVDQLLLFRKSDAGFDQINPTKIDFDRLCKEVYLCFTQQAASNHIEYTYTSFSGNHGLYADSMKIEIVLFNLISNALKYTPMGGRVQVILEDEENSLLLSVLDTGPGIPESAGNKIFDRFYQAERTDNKHKSGFGIGLFLAKQFTDSHNGEIGFEHVPSGGSCFFIRLLKGSSHLKGNFSEEDLFKGYPSIEEISAHADVSDVEQLPEINSIENEFISDRQSILIVDDEPDIRKYIAGLFKHIYTVYEAGDGQDGLAMVNEKLPDLIITDFKMQGIDGIEFTQLIKSNPTLSYIPVILLTASSSQEIKLKSVHGGADDYISKPFETEYLIARVANLLKNRNNLQNYFFNEITLQKNSVVVSEEYKRFLDVCIRVVEKHLTDSDFGIKILADEVGMSHSNLYKRVKSISGQSVNAFIRFIRLRKAAELMINSDHNVTEVAFRSGFNDSKYFGKQFSKVFGLNPSEFIKKHRKSFNKAYKIK